MPMSQKVREKELPRPRRPYAKWGREGRSGLIDEVREQWGYSRKDAIKLLNTETGWGGDPAVLTGHPPSYGKEVEEVFWVIWKAA